MSKVLLKAAIGVVSLFSLGSAMAQDTNADAADAVAEEEVSDEDSADSNEGASNFSTKISGELQTFAAAGKQDLSFGKDHGYFATSGNILFNPTVTTDRGYIIGGTIGFGADASSGQQCASGISESFISISGWFGEFQFGNQCSAADELSIDGTAALGGQEGAAGSISSLFNVSGGALLQAGASGDDGIATKLIYLSPIWSLKKCGTLQVAISYTPNSQSVGMLQNITHINYLYHGATYNQQGNLLYDIDESGMAAGGAAHTKKNSSNLPDQNTDLSNGAFYLDGVTGAIVYNYGSDDAFNFAFAVCGWYGKGKAQIPTLKVKDLTAYQVGSTIGYKQWKLALGFTDNLKSLMNKTCNDANGVKDGADMGKVFTVGLAWEQGPWKASAGYFHSTKKYAKNDDQTKAQVATLAVDYKFMEGVAIFGEFDWIKTTGRSTAAKRSWVQSTSAFADNKGWLLFAGTKINF